MAEFATFQDLWPLVIIQAPAHSTFESIEYFCERQGDLFKRRERFATINDMTRMRGLLDARCRKHLADWTKAHDGEIRRWHVASANIVESALIRGVITAVHWFAKPPSPQETTPSMLAGVDFVIDHLRRDGVVLGAKLADYRASLTAGGRASAR
jgi:hypothetical protein